MKRKALFPLFILFVIFFKPLYGEQTGIIQKKEVIVLFNKPLRIAAKEVADIYSGLKAELEKTLRWKLNFRPTVLLIKNRDVFQRMAGSNLVVAFAMPQRKLVVIDCSKINAYPFALGITLKHELCHLLLHNYIKRGNLPKWLDEGVCQFVSDGIAEILMYKKRSVLNEATLSGKYISIKDLTERFPKDEKPLLLAYEESKSLVEYIISKFGRNGILKILEYLKDGDEVDVAILKSLSISFDELERRWHNHLSKRITWFTYLSNNIYGMLFFLAALITIYGFIRLLKKKRAYKDEEDDYYFL